MISLLHGTYRASKSEIVQLTWGATKIAEVAVGSSGGKGAVHPEDDNIANASVRTPPSNRVIDDWFPHPVVKLDAGITTAPSPTPMFSFRSPAHSPSQRVSLKLLELSPFVPHINSGNDSSSGTKADLKAKQKHNVDMQEYANLRPHNEMLKSRSSTREHPVRTIAHLR